ncbi:hypothetical protein [Metallibacterium sp.]|jgi:hypothetical protein|uniref:hypothetical protein n=2 Tax=Metallibacterium sp. TaxID=2940281 RepID=UPI00262B47CE|nr:hypothetical protein [Metallibacterium sp.]
MDAGRIDWTPGQLSAGKSLDGKQRKPHWETSEQVHPRVTAGFDFMYSSGLRAGFANTQTMPGWLQLNLSMGRRFDLPDLGTLHARLALVNALDRVIELRNGTGLGVGLAPQYAQRRGVYLTLRKNF